VPKVIKSLVVRLSADEHVMVLVPGDRVIDWARLRSLLGVSRLSLATSEEAFAVTGYERGAITPLGSRTRLPVIVDAAIDGAISLGGGAHGVAVNLDTADLVLHLGASVAEVTKPAG
jgi:Cys-tRNA(Pro) deacylase